MEAADDWEVDQGAAARRHEARGADDESGSDAESEPGQGRAARGGRRRGKERWVRLPTNTPAERRAWRNAISQQQISISAAMQRLYQTTGTHCAYLGVAPPTHLSKQLYLRAFSTSGTFDEFVELVYMMQLKRSSMSTRARLKLTVDDVQQRFQDPGGGLGKFSETDLHLRGVGVSGLTVDKLAAVYKLAVMTSDPKEEHDRLVRCMSQGLQIYMDGGAGLEEGAGEGKAPDAEMAVEEPAAAEGEGEGAPPLDEMVAPMEVEGGEAAPGEDEGDAVVLGVEGGGGAALPAVPVAEEGGAEVMDHCQ